MSLLNTMLNDLEKRQATVGAEQSLPKNIFSPARKTFSIPLLLLVVAVAGIGVLALISYQKPGTLPPVVQVAAVNNLPKVNPVSVKPAPAAENAPLPSPPTPVAQAAPDAASKPSVPPVAIQQAAKPEAAAVHKEPASTQAATSIPTGNKKVAAAAATKPATPIANETADTAVTPKRDKPKTLADQAPSFKVIRPQQQSDNFYRQAISLVQQSRAPEAQNALRQAVNTNPANHGARQLLVELLIDAGRNEEATTLLRDGLEISPGHSSFSMALARLQVANGAKEEALSTMEQGLHSAGNDAEYHAFIAALLQGQGRNAEATQHYITALRSNPSMPSWLIGVGISLEAENNMNDAAAAFQRALDTGELSVEVAQFADQQLKQIRQQH